MTRTVPDIFLDKKRFFNIIQSYVIHAAVAELADARDLKSLDGQLSYRFDPGQRHHIYETSKITIHDGNTGTRRKAR